MPSKLMVCTNCSVICPLSQRGYAGRVESDLAFRSGRLLPHKCRCFLAGRRGHPSNELMAIGNPR